MTALPRQLSRVGKRGARWIDWQKRQRAIVMRRARGVCEVCFDHAATDWHHCFNRRQLSEPLSSHHTLTSGLCRRCHREITDGRWLNAARDLQDIAIGRAMQEFGYDDLGWCDDPLDDAREIERRLKVDTEAWRKLCDDAGVTA